MPLTPKAAERLGREAAGKAFGPAARSLNYDWETRLDARQVQRWAQAMGRRVAVERDAEAKAFEAGVRPTPPANEPELIVVGMDGGRVQFRPDGEGGASAGEDARPPEARPEEAQPKEALPEAALPEAARPEVPPPQATQPKEAPPQTARPEVQQPKAARPEGAKGHWREDKVCTVSTYLCGDGKDPEQGGRAPQKLVTTHVATMGDSDAVALLARVEAERRGLRQARQVIVMGDFAKWVDTAAAVRFARYTRVGDWGHAAEHLWEAAKAARGRDAPQSPAVAALEGELETLLWGGKVGEVISRLKAEAAALGPVQSSDGPLHPRRVLDDEIGFFERNEAHMNYPEYRRRGWPIGSGNTEAGVKQFNKRVKGTEQFWSEPGVEAILALRALYVSQDQRWDRYWLSRAAYSKAA